MNALTGGDIGMGIFNAFQAGQQARFATDGRNALGAYAANPTREGLGALAQYQPEFAISERTRFDEADTATRERQVRQRAAAGDPAAMAELSGIDLAAYRGLSADKREQLHQNTTILGNAAIDILNRPPEQRGQVFNAYLEQLIPQMPELAEYRGLPAEQIEPILRSAVASAEMMPRLLDQERPSYQAIPAGGTLVNTRDPAAVSQFGQQTAPQAPVAKQIGAATYYQGQDGQWYDNAAEAQGGGGSNVTSGFPGR